MARELSGVMLADMELYQLKAFVQVAQEGNLSRAAVKLFTSQPAVSAQIKALEETLGVLLFERTPKGMRLTQQGQVLRLEAEKALAAAQGILLRAQSLRGELEGRLHLGTISDPMVLRLAELLSRLVARHPRLDIRLAQGHSGTVAEGVLSGELDAAYVIGEVEARLENIVLTQVRLVVAIPTCLIPVGEDLSWAQLCCHPWIGVPENCSFRRMGQAPESFVVTAEQEQTMGQLITAGMGLCLLREDQARGLERQGLVHIWPEASVDTRMSLVYRAERHAEPRIAALLAFVREVWQLV